MKYLWWCKLLSLCDFFFSFFFFFIPQTGNISTWRFKFVRQHFTVSAADQTKVMYNVCKFIFISGQDVKHFSTPAIHNLLFLRYPKAHKRHILNSAVFLQVSLHTYVWGIECKICLSTPQQSKQQAQWEKIFDLMCYSIGEKVFASLPMRLHLITNYHLIDTSLKSLCHNFKCENKSKWSLLWNGKAGWANAYIYMYMYYIFFS